MTRFTWACFVTALGALVAMFVVPEDWWPLPWLVAIVAAAVGAIALQETGR